MYETVKNHALPVCKKNRIASLLCIFESIIKPDFPCLADEIANHARISIILNKRITA